MRDDEAGADAEQLALRNHSERAGICGSWEWTPKTGALVWSDNLFRLFGLQPDAIKPSIDYALACVHPADRRRVANALRRIETREDTGSIDYRIVLDGDVHRHQRASLVLVAATPEGARRLRGSVQDITAQDSVARTLAAYASVSKALDEWQQFEHGAHDLLAGLGSAMEMAFGALWLPEGEALRVDTIWVVEDSQALESLAAATRGWHPGPGSPVLGRARRTRQPVITTGKAGGTRKRAESMRLSAITTAVAIPAVAGADAVAVLEFLSRERIEPTDRLLRALDGIGHEVGSFLARHRGELVPRLLTPREQQVLQLAARALSSAAIAADLGISRATVKRHFESAYAKLGVSDRVAAVAHAMRQGLIT